MIKAYRKILVGWLVAVFVAGCSNLSVFVPRNQASLFSGYSNVEVNEDGLLHLKWQSKNSNTSGQYQIYLSEVDASTAPFQFSEAATRAAPLTSEELEVDAGISPTK